MKSYLSLFLGLTLILATCSSDFRDMSDSDKISPSHELWDMILVDHVSIDGKVDYHSIMKDKRFDNYLSILSQAHPNTNWSDQDKMAFWINTYNAYTVKLIIDNWPVTSIKDIFLPWQRRIVTIESESYSLGFIEHKILRKEFNDPRIHFAINCASKSCPPLLNEAFSGATVNSQLEKVTSRFINDTKYNSIGQETLHLSKIFSWYKRDFTKSQTLLQYVGQYYEGKINSSAKINFVKYDWSLNQ